MKMYVGSLMARFVQDNKNVDIYPRNGYAAKQTKSFCLPNMTHSCN